MNPFDYPVFSFVVFIVFVSLLAFAINVRFKHAKAAHANLSEYDVAVRQGFVGTQEEWLLTQPRSVRRKYQFANQTDSDIEDRARKSQIRFFKTFEENLTAVYGQNLRFHDSVMNIIAIAEREIKAYRSRAHLTNRAENNISQMDLLIMEIISGEITQHAAHHKVADLAGIGMELMQFVEETFRIRHLNGVLYRNKGTVSQNQRCSAMAHCILKYFGRTELVNQGWSAIPLDYVSEDALMDNEEFRRDFFHEAIDHTYRSMMKVSEQDKFRAKDRIRNEEHEHNRKRRRARVKSSKKAG